VTLESMAQSFGVSVEFMDTELSHFIALKRLNCKIDKVVGIVMTTRVDQKNSQYVTISVNKSLEQASIAWPKLRPVLLAVSLQTQFRYQTTLKSGDVLLSQIQKLSQLVNM
jgi:hypothetical protein